MDFALILFVLSVVTGILWCFDFFVARKKRPKGTPDPWWVEYAASFFPVILPIFMLRSFWVEPFRIPSGSMIPTLQVGDFILVNKYTYGVRLPVLNKKVIEMNTPQRGDVMVFRFPIDQTQNYIKRVVGLPGDKIEYADKRLTINGEVVPVDPVGDYVYPRTLEVGREYTENFGGKAHSILNQPGRDFVPTIANVKPHPFLENCIYGAVLRCTVPAGHYFVMGDNRDDSEDSRYWGFVPDANVVGKAFFVWFHADNILPPSGIKFDRIGSFH